MDHESNVTVCAKTADTLKSSHISPIASLTLMLSATKGKLAIWGSSSL